jgi:hypothetical protein
MTGTSGATADVHNIPSHRMMSALFDGFDPPGWITPTAQHADPEAHETPARSLA